MAEISRAAQRHLCAHADGLSLGSMACRVAGVRAPIEERLGQLAKGDEMHEAWNFISNLKTLNESILSVHSTLDARGDGSEFQHGMHVGQMDAAGIIGWLIIEGVILGWHDFLLHLRFF